MGRPPVAERMEELKRGLWTPEEDIMLASYIQKHGPGNWRLVPSNAGLQRCGKSCRLRWKNYLRPGIKRGNFTLEEDRVIIRYQALLGNRWAAIAAHLPSRTDNDIKNYWHAHLKKKLAKVNSSGDERAKNYGLDHMKAYYEAGKSMTTTPQDSELKKSIYDDIGIPPLTSIEKWLLEDPSAPVPEVFPAPAPAPVPEVFPAPAPAAVPQILSAPASTAVSQVFPAPVPQVLLPALTLIEKWLLENPSAPVPQALPVSFPQFLRPLISAPVPQVLPDRAPAPFPQVPPAPASAPNRTGR